MARQWFLIEQPSPRFRGEGRRLLGPFYQARILDTVTGAYLPLFNAAPLIGRSSVRRAVTYGIQRFERRNP